MKISINAEMNSCHLTISHLSRAARTNDIHVKCKKQKGKGKKQKEMLVGGMRMKISINAEMNSCHLPISHLSRAARTNDIHVKSKKQKGEK